MPVTKEVSRLPNVWDPRTSAIRTGDNASSERNEWTTSSHATTCAASKTRDGLRDASPLVTEPQEESADGQAVHTGTEESKQPNGEVRQVAHGKDVKGRERRTADTLLHMIHDRGKR